MKLPKVYDPHAYEADIYALWEKTGAFQPRKAEQYFSVVVPPPNANGNLHMGHGLTLAIEDIMVRYHRLRGASALLLPGADHAGFETQVVYERELAKAGKSRFDFTREELYQQIWDFVAQNRVNFEAQLRNLGAGVDWSRFTFTLDEKITKRASATFKKMWDEGLVYRGERLVNFCTFHGTAFADIEVDYKEEQGKLWHIRYPLTDGSGEIIVATTRPETMLGDTGVAVHPDDKRYGSYVGKTVKLPLTLREIPIIADDFVETGFGTGAVKLTPAHDQNDYDAAKRHDLPMISVIDHEGKLSKEVPEAYHGLDVKAARAKVVADLEAQGFLIKTEDLTHNVGHCYKCGTVIEPMLREQWFVKVEPLAQRAIEALEAGKVAFHPAGKKDQLIGYLQGLRDWNISRQIAWGIPIPAFQNVDDADDWIYDERVEQEILEIDGKTYHRDPDVFDTWFSSGSWPYATLNYGAKDDEDFKRFYPLSMMETGFDILYPWVSRMIMLGLYVTGEVPFTSVYLHGLILDEHGQKMSKSKGNVLDPADSIKQYGSDAFRMGIITGQTPGTNQAFGESKLIAARNFCNKVWNIARYVEDRVGNPKELPKPQAKTNTDHWLLSKLQQTSEAMVSDFANYHFSEAYEKIYHFVWDDFADWYVEASKAEENLPLLAYALESILIMAHPFAPFLTETIWQTLAWEKDSILAVRSWPEIPVSESSEAAAFDEIKTIVSEARAICKALGIKGAPLHYTSSSLIEANAGLIQRLARLTAITKTDKPEGMRLTQSKEAAWLAIDPETAKRYTDKLYEQLEAEQVTIAKLSGRLGNDNYVKNAPQAIVDQTRQQLEAAKARLDAIQAELDVFAGTTR